MGGPLDQNSPGRALSRPHAAGPPRPPGERGRSAGAWPWLVDGPGWWMALAGAWPWLVRGPGWCVALAGAWPWLVRGPGWCVAWLVPGLADAWRRLSGARLRDVADCAAGAAPAVP